MKTYLTVCAFCLLGFVSGCMNVKARYTFNSETDFNTLKNYAWVAGTQELFSDPMHADRYMNAMNSQLASKGFTLVKDNPDFLIHTYSAKKYREIYSTIYGDVEFHRGKIALEFVDTKSGEVFWEGVAKAYLSEEAKTKEVKISIDKGVKELMKNFPPPVQN